MKELVVEWRHYDKEGSTCDRCAATGSSVEEVVSELREELRPQGIAVSYRETRLGADLMAESNMILLNGIPLEAVLEEASAGESHCPSCSGLTGSETSCRTVEHGGKSYEEVPRELIRKAAYKVLESQR